MQCLCVNVETVLIYMIKQKVNGWLQAVDEKKGGVGGWEGKVGDEEEAVMKESIATLIDQVMRKKFIRRYLEQKCSAVVHLKKMLLPSFVAAVVVMHFFLEICRWTFFEPAVVVHLAVKFIHFKMISHLGRLTCRQINLSMREERENGWKWTPRIEKSIYNMYKLTGFDNKPKEKKVLCEKSDQREKMTMIVFERLQENRGSRQKVFDEEVRNVSHTHRKRERRWTGLWEKNRITTMRWTQPN